MVRRIAHGTGRKVVGVVAKVLLEWKLAFGFAAWPSHGLTSKGSFRRKSLDQSEIPLCIWHLSVKMKIVTRDVNLTVFIKVSRLH